MCKPTHMPYVDVHCTHVSICTGSFKFLQGRHPARDKEYLSSSLSDLESKLRGRLEEE